MIDATKEAIGLLRRMKLENAALRQKLKPELEPKQSPHAIDDASGDGLDEDFAELERLLEGMRKPKLKAKDKPKADEDKRQSISHEATQSRVGLKQWATENKFKGSVLDAIAAGTVVVEKQGNA